MGFEAGAAAAEEYAAYYGTEEAAAATAAAAVAENTAAEEAAATAATTAAEEAAATTAGGGTLQGGGQLTGQELAAQGEIAGNPSEGVIPGSGPETVGNTPQTGNVPGSGPQTTQLANPAPETVQPAAQDLIQPNGPTPTPSPADASQYGLQQGQYVDPSTGEVVTPGSGTGAADQPGIIDRALQFSDQHPVVAGQAIGGVGKAALSYEQAQEKRKADRDAMAAKHAYDLDLATLKQRQTQANPSVGGGGVNLNITPGQKVLRRPDGSLVFVPVTGLINRNSGVRR